MAKTKDLDFEVIKGDYLLIKNPKTFITISRIENYDAETKVFLLLPGYNNLSFQPPIKEGRLLIPRIDFEYFHPWNSRRAVPKGYPWELDDIIYSPKDKIIISRNIEDITRVFEQDKRFSFYSPLVRNIIQPKQNKTKK